MTDSHDNDGERKLAVLGIPRLKRFSNLLIAILLYDLCVCVCLRVLQLMNLTDSRLAQAGNERLELAMLSFFEQFRKIYIGDQVQKSSKVRTDSLLLMVSF